MKTLTCTETEFLQAIAPWLKDKSPNDTIEDVVRCWIHESLFQFHNGSIKANIGTSIQDVKIQFQFHNGSIKAGTGGTIFVDYSSFQFHNGSIKAF